MIIREFLVAAVVGMGAATLAAEPWSPQTYPDNPGFLLRAAPTLPALAKVDFARRAQSLSTCPDTGLPVRTWAVEGEEIISPYTGRRYKQGETGYFGPKARDAQGRISAFGGDPLKYALPPATARMLLGGEGTAEARAYLSMPGNLSQQYHFAAVNWCRFYPLLGDAMGPQWRKEFAQAVAAYREERKPADGAREHARAVPFVHDLVGEENEHLGGNVEDGGTENHKTMWRTSGLLYSQLLPADGKISGFTVAEAERITTKVLSKYHQDLLVVGNGEYDSSTYYPYQIRGYLNLYDFSPKQQTREMAQFALDYYLATYGMKVFNGTIAGVQKRGWEGGPELNEMDMLVWAFSPRTTYAVPAGAPLSIQQATTGYRPNRVIHNIITKNVPLPFEAQIARPTYHLKDANAFQETFYCADGFAMGSVAMTMVDNPTQQTVWSLATRGATGSIILGGGQPKFRLPEGHSPYDQVIQKRSALILLTGPTGAKPEGELGELQQRRLEAAGATLVQLPPEMPASERWEKASNAAETWLFIPKLATVQEKDGVLLVDGGDGFVAVRPIGTRHFELKVSGQEKKEAAKAMEMYRVIVAQGEHSGFVIDAGDRKTHGSFEAFSKAVAERTSVDLSKVKDGVVKYHSLLGDELEMRYQALSMRAEGSINGKAIDWKNWADGGVYDSPLIKSKAGVMRISDGTTAYEVDHRGERPVWREVK